MSYEYVSVAQRMGYQKLPVPEKSNACLKRIGRTFCFLHACHKGPCRPGINR